MFRDYSKSTFANGCLGIMNENYRKDLDLNYLLEQV